ncbi:heme peroxidase, partial [Cynara cardunculus var. scolymus]
MVLPSRTLLKTDHNPKTRQKPYNMGKNYPTVSDEYNRAVDEVRRKLKDLIAEKGSAPLMLRLATKTNPRWKGVSLIPMRVGTDHLRDVFVKTMGLTDEDIVALSGGHTLLPTDKALLGDPVFRPLVDKFAADKDAFFNAYAESHMKFSE